MPVLFGFLGPSTMVIVALVALLLFGNRLPSVMRSLGEGVSEFKKGLDQIGEPLNEVKSIGSEITREGRKIEQEIRR